MKINYSEMGVGGSQATNQSSTPTTPTPTSTEVIATKTYTFLEKGGLGA